MVSGTKPMEPAACRETLHSMAFGPQLGVGERFLGYGGNVCKLYDSTFGARAEVCGTTFTSNHLRKVDRGRSVFDGNKRSVTSRRFSTISYRLSIIVTYRARNAIGLIIFIHGWIKIYFCYFCILEKKIL